MLMDVRPSTVLFAALLGGALLLPAAALAQSDAMQESETALEEKAAESMPGVGMMEDDPELMEGSDAMKESRKAMGEHQTTGAGGEMKTDPDLLEGGSDAAREQREKMMDMGDDATQ